MVEWRWILRQFTTGQFMIIKAWVILCSGVISKILKKNQHNGQRVQFRHKRWHETTTSQPSQSSTRTYTRRCGQNIQMFSKILCSRYVFGFEREDEKSSKNSSLSLSISGTMLLDYEGFVELSEITKTSFAEFIFERMITRSSDPTEKEGVDAVGFILASYNFCSTPKENLPSFLFDIFSRGNVQMDRLHTVRMIRVLYRSTSKAAG